MIFKHIYRGAATISTDKVQVWNTLLDFPSYKRWNQFTPEVKTTLQIGDPVYLTVQMFSGKKALEQKEYITRYEDYMIGWGFRWPLLLKAERTQTVTSVEQKTYYETIDTISGLLSPVVHLIYGKAIEQGFQTVANDLKNYCEANG